MVKNKNLKDEATYISIMNCESWIGLPKRVRRREEEGERKEERRKGEREI